MYFVCLKLYVHDTCFCMHFVLYLYLSLCFSYLFVGGIMSYLRYLCFLCILVSNTYCVVFLFLFEWNIDILNNLSKYSQYTKCICTKIYIAITCFVFSISIFFFFTICSYLLSSFCVPYVVSISRFSMFALHFGILLRLFCKCDSCILILLDKCMLWWFHVRINTNYVRYQHIVDDGMYCIWLITLSI